MDPSGLGAWTWVKNTAVAVGGLIPGYGNVIAAADDFSGGHYVWGAVDIAAIAGDEFGVGEGEAEFRAGVHIAEDATRAAEDAKKAETAAEDAAKAVEDTKNAAKDAKNGEKAGKVGERKCHSGDDPTGQGDQPPKKAGDDGNGNKPPNDKNSGGAEDDGKADKGIVAQNGTKITGFTDHGVDRAIGDAAQRAGTTPQAILDALKNPWAIEDGVDSQGRPFERFDGQNATVVVNPETGKVITMWPTSGAGAH